MMPVAMLWMAGLSSHAADLAIVIDDVGYSQQLGLRALHLPGSLTIAVLPFAPYTAELAADALRLGKDVIIHQPMEPQPSPTVKEEAGTLKLNMREEEFDQVLSQALAAVPQRSGMSNHTGSLLTAHHLPMARLMWQLSSRGLYFLDSRTTAQTVAVDMAERMGVPVVRRDVFLDHHRNPRAIHLAFEQALATARRKGYAVLIGHPYPMSLDYLERRLADLPADINLVHAAQLARRFNRPATPDPQPHQGYLHISPVR